MEKSIDSRSAPPLPAEDHREPTFGGNAEPHGTERQTDHPTWDDTPLQVKMPLVVVAAVVGGALIGILETRFGHPVWVLATGLTVWVAALWWLAQAWICRPFERLLRQLERIHMISRPGGLDALLMRRRDEIGKLAHAVHAIATAALRDQREVRRLRRTVDHRVARATLRATLQLKQMAMRDALTDLGNRNFLDANLDALVESVRESNGDLVCVMMDLDNFKMINDTRGHAAGDELLIFLASLIRANTRRSDVAVRLGGDEFVIFLPGCSSARVQKMTDAIRSLFRQHARAAVNGQVSVSMGVAGLKRDRLVSGQALLQRADQRLYMAKRDGKDCIAGIGGTDQALSSA